MEIQTNQQPREPQERKQPKKTRVCRRFRKSCIVVLLTALLGISIRSGVKFYDSYQNPLLEGEWISSETGINVEFTKNGKVIVDQVEIGSYVITAPDSMVYHIEDQVFNMHYGLNQRSLIWGIVGEEEEIFERKQEWDHLGLDIFSLGVVT